MSFAVHARRVRDESLLFQRRVTALRSCVQIYRPFGFRVTLSFLEQEAGRYTKDDDALLRALDILTASREEWKAAARDHALQRRKAKARGHRCVPPADPNPSARPDRWYGAAQRAALHALAFRLHHNEVDADLISLATTTVATAGDLSEDLRRYRPTPVVDLISLASRSVDADRDRGTE